MGDPDRSTAPAGTSRRRSRTEGTASDYAQLENISSAGKTGTGEFCDQVSNEKGLCVPGAWPTHAWYAAFAPYEDPEIAVVAFVYNGAEGAITAGPILLASGAGGTGQVAVSKTAYVAVGGLIASTGSGSSRVIAWRSGVSGEW